MEKENMIILRGVNQEDRTYAKVRKKDITERILKFEFQLEKDKIDISKMRECQRQINGGGLEQQSPKKKQEMAIGNELQISAYKRISIIMKIRNI